MQVSVETTKGLNRKLTVQLPGEQLEKAFDERLRSLSKTVKLAGFRAGKIPLKVIRQKYGAGVKQEVLEDLIKRSYSDAINQENLKPAGLPHIDTKPVEIGQDFQFIATFEVFPEVELADFAKIKLTNPKTELIDDDVMGMIDKLRTQRATWEVVERAAQSGDQVKIDFEGTLAGEQEPFEGGSAKDFSLVLGSKQMIEGFEDQIVGVKAGEERKIKVKFPKDYNNEALQGKKAVFIINCSEVLEQKLPEINEDFIKSFGIESGDLEELKKQLKEHLQRELDENVKLYTKRQIMDELVRLHKIELPNVLVDREIENLQQQMLQRLNLGKEALGQLPREPYEEKARRQVTLQLLVSEVVKHKELKADPEHIKSLLMRAASSYQDPQEMLQYYMNNKELLKNFEMLALEDKVVEFLASEAKASEKTMSFNDLVQENQNAG